MTQTNPVRPSHPILADLVGGLELSSHILESQNGNAELARMLATAEYWLSFEMASFETLLAKCPSPLRELGVAVTLRFSERMLGELTIDEIEVARNVILPELTGELRAGIENGLATLERAVRARDAIEELRERGFSEYSGGKGTSIHALRAMGKSNITVEGGVEKEKRVVVELGKPVVLSATDERGRPLDPPEVESRMSAPVLIKDAEKERIVVFYVPGEYQLRVPGKATGERRLLAG